jgi:hypothetical protein
VGEPHYTDEVLAGRDAHAKTTRPFRELVPAAVAYDLVRGVTLARLDAHVRGHESAAAWLAGDLPALLAARGIAVAVH